MTNKQINAAIAEACGWRQEDGVYMWTANGIDCTCPELWDWCNDLNAMNQAEKVLNQDNLYIMALHIEGLCGRGEFYFRATARQRAEAFLRVLGKWEEVQG